MAVLELAHACRVYGAGRLAVRALEDVSLRVEAGEFVAVMGPSGSGKSTLLNVAGSLERPTSGRVLVSGADLAGAARASSSCYGGAGSGSCSSERTCSRR
jgi:ABC-type lipoprotein export system ATPase subunit